MDARRPDYWETSPEDEPLPWELAFEFLQPDPELIGVDCVTGRKRRTALPTPGVDAVSQR